MTITSRDVHTGKVVARPNYHDDKYPGEEWFCCSSCGKWVDAEWFDLATNTCELCFVWPAPPPEPTGACSLCGAPVARDGQLCPKHERQVIREGDDGCPKYKGAAKRW